jgi:hypothetical protein
MSEKSIDPEKLSQLRENLRRHRIAKRLSELVLKTAVRVRFGESHRSVKPYQKIGLLEGSIIGSEVSYPDEDSDGTKVCYHAGKGGQLLGYDFRKPEIFSKDFKEDYIPAVSEGSITAFLIDEVKDNDPDKLTPISLFRFFDMSHLLTLNTYTVGELEDHGLVRQKTHREAYEHMGLYDAYAEDLSRRRMQDAPVFQITPKGNTLVFLTGSSGDQTPQEQKR